MGVRKIAEGVYEVGVKDWNIRDFHGYSTEMGTSYNAFLVRGEKTVLLDTVKKPFADELVANISQIMDPKQIDFVISNHTEMDHSGSLARIMHLVGENKPLYCSKMGAKNLAKHFRRPWNLVPVASGDSLDLGGGRTLSFLETRMLHWPDSMFTYLADGGILFSSDAFGQHYAGYEVFDNQVAGDIMHQAKKYFANILLPYADRVTKLLDQVAKSGLDIRMICPDHGVLWQDPGRILETYGRWANQPGEKEAVVAYDTMWHSTQSMAEAIAEGISSQNVTVKPYKTREWHRSDIMTAVFDAKAFVVGSPTLNNQIYPTVADMLTYVRGLRPKNKVGAAFGSFGWSGESVKIIEAVLTEMQVELVHPGLKIQYVPEEKGLDACREMGRAIGAAVLAG